MEYANSFGEELWSELRPWCLHVCADAIRSASIILLLYLFWEVITLLRLRGYPPDSLSMLERTHFCFMWVALVILGGSFVGQAFITLWRKKR